MSEEKQSTKRLDTLRQLEKQIQDVWETEKTFVVDAGEEDYDTKEKFFVTFPFAYMNGFLHLGHAFSFSKSDFAAGYWAAKGSKVLYPLAFHCTGMPISAAAEKLRRELAAPPPAESPSQPQDSQTSTEATVPQKGKSTHSKAASKTVANATQMEILSKLGIPDEEIPKFSDANHWVDYFPPIGKSHFKAFGSMTDWRRAFITTDLNPYFDSFVRWQFIRLKEMGLIKFGKRASIFSQTDKQPCADHDRASGEGVGPQEYTIVKMRLLKDSLPEPLALLKDEPEEIFLGAATLRPETMYGQTNCWVGLTCRYGAWRLKKGQGIIVCTERAALNLSYQLMTEEFGKPDCLARFTGSDLIGCEVEACLTPLKRVRVLPYAGVNENKGTGVVTSVPSDAPDDWWGLDELKIKPDLRVKWGVKDEWVVDLEPIEIIEVDVKEDAVPPCEAVEVDAEESSAAGEKTKKKKKKVTRMIAKDYCMDIKKTVAESGAGNLPELKQRAKEDSYLRSFYSGRLVKDIPEYGGRLITEVKTLVREMLIARGDAFVYYEPEKMVKSRSGDECVVALVDQWFVDYANEEWKNKTREALKRCNVFFPEVRKTFEQTIDWLREWGCSRQFGLGTRLPWDETVLIESLSDSTIYNAYYTVCHFLQGDMYGRSTGSLGIEAKEMTLDAWDYVFQLKDEPSPSLGEKDAPFVKKLETMRKEFEYWYPVDVRVSGKDLIRNHLSFFLFNHTAMFKERHWPRGIRSNGHLLLNDEKMSKSTGNFLTIEEAIEKFSASAVRIALAEAGDSWDDANFKTTIATNTLLKLTKEMAWIEETVKAIGGVGMFRSEEGKGQDISHTGLLQGEVVKELSFFERVFDARMNAAVRDADRAYKQMLFREALTRGYYSIVEARDQCRDMCDGKVHPALLMKYIETSLILLTPIARHYTDHIWRNVLGKAGTVTQGTWPRFSAQTEAEIEAADNRLIEEGKFFTETLRETRVVVVKAIQPKKPKKGAPKTKEPPTFPSSVKCTIYVRDEYFEWQKVVMNILRELFPTLTVLENAHVPSPCACAKCTAAVSGSDDEDGEGDAGVSDDTIQIKCTKQPGAYSLFQSIVKEIRYAHLHKTLPLPIVEAIEKYQERVNTEFTADSAASAASALSDLPTRVAALVFTLSGILINAKSGGKHSTIEAGDGPSPSSPTQPPTPAELKLRTKVWNELAGEALRFGTFMIDRARKARNMELLSDTPLFTESSLLNQNIATLRQALVSTITIEEKKGGKAMGPSGTTTAAVEVEAVTVPVELTEDELTTMMTPPAKGAAAAKGKTEAPKTATDEGADEGEQKLPPVALRSVPTKPKLKIFTSD